MRTPRQANTWPTTSQIPSAPCHVERDIPSPAPESRSQQTVLHQYVAYVPPPPNILHPARSFAQSPPLYHHPMPLYYKELTPLPLCPITGASSAETRAKTRPTSPTLSPPPSPMILRSSLPLEAKTDAKPAARGAMEPTHRGSKGGRGGVGRGERRTVTSYNGLFFPSALPYPAALSSIRSPLHHVFRERYGRGPKKKGHTCRKPLNEARPPRPLFMQGSHSPSQTNGNRRRQYCFVSLPLALCVSP